MRLFFAFTPVLCAFIHTTQAGSSVTIKGSDTLNPLTLLLAEAFMKKNPGLSISVSGGGSGVGIAAIINGTTDIAQSSRPMAEKEIKLAQSKGIDVHGTPIAKDALSVIVHPSNKIADLTLEQIKNIYTGQTKNWKELGGADLPILVYSRESSSGTFVFFQEHVMQKQDYGPKTRMMSATAPIVAAVKDDVSAIGYVGLGYAESAKGKVREVPVRIDANSPPVTPSIKSIHAKTYPYPVSRDLYFYTRGNPSGVIKSFIDFIVSDEGQNIVWTNDYAPLKDMSAKKAAKTSKK